MDFATIIAGLTDALTPLNLLFVLAGVFVGQFVGAMPGIGPVMAMAIAIPFTFALNPLPAIGFLVGVNKGGLIGGAIPAILLNTPGTPDAAATAIDGYPLTKQGKPLKAMKMALYASVTGDTFSDIVLITVAAPLAILALQLGPVEIFALMVFAFSLISGLIGDSISRGAIATALGLLAATVGLDPEHSTPRFLFGMFQLYDGFPIASVAIGSLAVSEITLRVARMRGKMRPAVVIPKNQTKDQKSVSFAEYWACRFVLLRGSLIGTFIGAVPGMGSTAAAFMSYASTKQTAKDPSSFGKGDLRGIAATESANSSVAGADFIPLLTLGLPGSASAAIMIGAFLIQGIQPGPLLFEQQGQLVYGIFGAMIMANACNLLCGLFGLRLWSKLITAPESVVFSIALVLCVTGVYLATGGAFGVFVMILFAVIGVIMTVLRYPLVVFIIAFFLGPRFELSLGQTATILRGDVWNLANHPVAVVLFAMSIFSIYWLGIKKRRRKASD
ncbi:tripartite tricarboxylate transporter permease [Litoreibacter arenae]|uniref:Tricarboxylate transport membrane protein TctA n=1 Tax=Litoreibacter arenae DSM 19593 TaxID=1123360 RepID=S9S4Z6_9RHOB|nr:tripartite tricarboxylate transporter permease [Litoreibacter arenae]EPX81244.1 Tricarboxylate transport membrane protein TctA [Litoreibacter arenae DSM 19593]